MEMMRESIISTSVVFNSSVIPRSADHTFFSFPSENKKAKETFLFLHYHIFDDHQLSFTIIVYFAYYEYINKQEWQRQLSDTCYTGDVRWYDHKLPACIGLWQYQILEEDAKLCGKARILLP